MVHKVSNRPQRVAELIRRELAMMLMREIHDEAARKATITDVEVSRDLKNARVYFSVLGGAAQADKVAKALNHAAGFFHHALRDRLSMKSVPEVRFYFDKSLETGARIDSLLAEAARKDSGENR